MFSNLTFGESIDAWYQKSLKKIEEDYQISLENLKNSREEEEKKINKKYAIYCSPGHLIDFKPKIKNQIKLKKILLKHQVKKKFQYSLEWEKNQLAIWDNRSMLHQATPFKGNRIMHRITIH